MIGSYKLIIAGINIPFITWKREESFSFFFLYFFFIKKKEKRSFVQKTEREEHVLLWEEHYSIRNVEKRERVYSYSRTRIFKRTDTVSWLHFSKKKNPFSSLRTFFFFRIFPLLSLHSRGSPRCNATPRENKSLSPKFPFLFRYLPLSCLLSILFLKRGKEKNTKTYVYVLYVLSRKTIKVIWKETEKWKMPKGRAQWIQ